jgi:hypothetical protein
MSDVPERFWAICQRGFEAYAGTWIDEKDGPDATECFRADVANALVADALQRAAEVVEPTDHDCNCVECKMRGAWTKHILALIQPDQSAALARIRDEARDADRRPLPYSISAPEGGFKNTFTDAEKAKLRPIAETLAMLDGNAFFTVNAGESREWFEQYLPEASALYEGNGGDDGWAGEASFARIHSASATTKQEDEG